MLIKTLQVAFDDLLHFVVLFIIVFTGFAVIAHVNFGGMRQDCHTIENALEALFEVMMGEPMPSKVEARFQEPEDAVGFAIFISLYTFIVFFGEFSCGSASCGVGPSLSHSRTRTLCLC